MEIVFILFGLGLLLISLMMYRNYLVYSVRVRASDFIFSQDNWDELLQKKYSGPSYTEMMFQFNKWNYKQFYPDFN